MHPFTENLITTKDASEQSGYTSDYLARLVRSGEISGKRIGHNWLIDSASLGLFLQKQKDRKIDRARELAEARVQEYRVRTQPAKDFSEESLTTENFVPGSGIAPATLSSRVFALTVAFLVVIVGAALARASVLPELAQRAGAVAYEASVGFASVFGDMPSSIASSVTATSDAMHARLASVADTNLRSSSQIASPALISPDLSFLRSATGCVGASCETQDMPARRVAFSREVPAPRPGITRESLVSLASAVTSLVSSPHALTDTVAGAYASVGEGIYDGIRASFGAYRAFIENAGEASLAFAGTARDSLGASPSIAAELGQVIVDATHAIIRADVAATYGLAAAAPATARVAGELIGTTGAVLAYGAAHVPSLAVALFTRATEVPAVFAPALAQAVFDAEYRGATHFVAFSSGISDRYLALIEASGRAGYAGVVGAQTLASALTDTPRVLENTYLGVLGKTALALDTAAHVSPVAAVLVAVAPTLSAGEQAALAVYETIHNFFDATGRTLAVFFAPSPAPVTPTPRVPAKSVVIATSTPARPTTIVRQTTNSYPTYTTLVQGVSQDFVRESLSTLRADILATTAGMLQPVAAQGVTNMNTIQYVNMIQDLANLIVRNGDFRGGTFDSGRVTNGISVAATTGTFTNLIAQATSLGTTSVGGDLTVSGTLTPAVISAGTSVSAPYFVATSTTATSTFAGSLTVGTNQFVVRQSTGNVGIGTTSPGSLFSVGNTNGWNFFDNGTTTSYAKGIDLKNGGCFAVNGTCVGGSTVTGTTGQVAYFSGTDTAVGTSTLFISPVGNLGIGNAAPSYKLDVAGLGHFTGLVDATSFTATSSAATSLFNGALTVSGNTILTNATTTNLFSTTASSTNLFAQSASLGTLTANSLTLAAPLAIASGGTGQTSFAASQVHYGNFATVATSSIANGTNITVTNGGTAYVLGAQPTISLSGTVGVTNGGIGINSVADGALLMGGVGGGTTPLAALATSTGGFLSNAYATGRPAWTATSTIFGTGTGGQVLAWNNGVPQFVATTTFSSGLAYSSGNVTNTGLLSLAQTYGSAQTGAISLATSTTAVSNDWGITNIGSAFTFNLPTATASIRGLLSGTDWTTFNSKQTSSLAKGNFLVGNDAGVAQATSSIFISSTGNVGIGTVNPDSKLEVAGNIHVDAGSLIRSDTYNNAANSANIIYRSGTDTVVGKNSSLYVQDGGNVGIGTTSPVSKLAIVNGTNELIFNDPAVNSSANYLTVKASNGVNGQSGINLKIDTTNLWQVLTDNNAAGAAGNGFFVQYQGNSANRFLSVNTNGNVGIGTTTPNWLLHVAGTRPSLALSDTSAAANLKHWLFSSQGGNLYVGTSTDAYGTSTPAALTILNGGNVGIGNTAPTYGLSVNSSTGVNSYNGVAGLGKFVLGDPLDPSGYVGMYRSAAGPANVGTAGNSLGFGSYTDMTFSLGAASFSGQTERMRILASNGNVGVGTNNPDRKLSVADTGDVWFDINNTNVNGHHFEIGIESGVSANAGKLQIYDRTNGAYRLTIDNTGNVGIGSTTPAQLLSVAGKIYTTGGIQFADGSLQTAAAAAAAAGTQGQIGFYNVNGSTLSGTSTITISQAGNVGVGTTTPSATLDVGLSGASSLSIGNATTKIISVGGSSIGRVAISGGTQADQIFAVSTGGTNQKYVQQYSTGGNLNFRTLTDAFAVGTEIMSLTNSGNVGIGTTSPTATLAVSGTANIDSTTTPYLSISRSATSTAFLGIASGTGSFFSGNAVNNLNLRWAAGTSFNLGADNGAGNASPAMTINSTGNIGIGSTTPWAQLSVNPNGITGPAFAIGSSTATNFIVTNGGNVGIGTTTPLAQLEMYGTGQTTAALTDAGSRGGMLMLNTDSTVAGNGGALVFGSSQSHVVNSIGFAAIKGLLTNGANATVGDLAFSLRNASTASALTERLRILSTGHVGIGTSAPASLNGRTIVLEVAGGGTIGTSGIVMRAGTSYSTNPAWEMALTNPTGTETAWNLYNGTSPVITARNSGNVGIGTASPGAPLEIVTANATQYATTTILAHNISDSNFMLTARRGETTDTSSSIAAKLSLTYAGSNENASINFHRGGGTTAGFLSFSTNDGTEKMRLDSSGNLGIGTTTPSVKLDVRSQTPFRVGNTDFAGSTGTYADIQFGAATGNTYTRLQAFNGGGGSGGILSLNPLGGFVGVGTLVPASTLAVESANTVTDSWGNISARTTDTAAINKGGQLTLGGYFNNATSFMNFGTIAGRKENSTNNNPQGYLAFGTGNSSGVNVERMRIDSTGDVGLGTTSPATLLEVGGATANVTFDGYKNCTGFTSNGNGLLACTASDQRLKQDIMSLATSSGLAAIGALNPVSFNWKPEADRGDQKQYGLIAQQVREVFPNLVTVSNPTALTPDGMLSVNYVGLIAPMILAIQELNGKFLVPAGATSTPTSLLAADSKSVDLYKLATYAASGIEGLSARMDAQDVRITALETRITALESGAVSSASGSPIAFSTTSLASALSSFGVLVEKGIAQFNTLVFRQLVASKDADGTSSAGSVTLLTGNTVAQVNNSLVLPSTKVFVTFNSQIAGSWWVSDKVAGSFRVVLSAPQTTDVSFDYFLVQTEGQIATSTPSVQRVSQSSGPDTVAPVITLLGDNPLHVSVGGTFAEPGVTVVDAVDGTVPYITFINGIEQVISSATITTSSPTTYLITYQATDAAGNTATAMRSVIIGNPDGTVSVPAPAPVSTDTVAPVVTLVGAAAMQITVGDTFADPGATATDAVDGNLTASITVTGSVGTTTAGLYSLTYSATDAAGNTGTVSRVVTVTSASSTPPTTIP